MKAPFLLLIACCLLSFSYAQITTPDELFREGIALHDKGDYAGAIKDYDAAIKLDPAYQKAYVEKTMSLFYAGQYEDCIKLCKEVLKKFPGTDNNMNVYVNYGSSLDAMGKPDEAIKIYTEGIKKFPDAYLLPFNRGVTEYLNKHYDDGIADFEKSVTLKPVHASSHQYLAYTIYTKNKMATVLSLSTFLLLEPEGQRAEKNLKLLLQVLGANVEKKDDKNITISLSADALKDKKGAADDFHLVELAISLSAALDNDSTFRQLSPAQKLKNKLEFFTTHEDDASNTAQKGFFTRFYIPFIVAMKKADLLETACYIMYTSSGDEANKKWLEDNHGKVEDFHNWLAAYKW